MTRAYVPLIPVDHHRILLKSHGKSSYLVSKSEMAYNDQRVTENQPELWKDPPFCMGSFTN
jgi:hypothetical protein